MIGTYEPERATPLVVSPEGVEPFGPTRTHTGAFDALVPPAAVTVTVNGIVPPFDATSISEAVVGSAAEKAGQSPPVVYAKARVSLLDEVAGVKFADGELTTSEEGGLDTIKVTGMVRLRLAGEVEIAIEPG